MCVGAASFRRARIAAPGAKAGPPSLEFREASALARLLITPGASGVTAPPGTVGARTAGLRRTGWRWVVLLAAGWLIQAGLRVWFSRLQTIPLADPDEVAYLIAARVLAGGPVADLSGSTLYQGGYPLLITPVYWFTQDPHTVYRAVMLINAAISAAVMPLGYLVCRRLGLDRRPAYAVAMVAALLPTAIFYSQYAMTDAIFPMLTLAWLLAMHSWLTASTARGRYAAAAGSALLAGYAYMVHSRGLVMLAGFAVVAAFLAWRRPAWRRSAAVAAAAALATAGAGWLLNRYLTSVIYPEGTRSLSGQMRLRLASATGIIQVVEMAIGQLWRLVLDSWGIAGIGLAVALFVIVRRDVRSDLRIMAGLAVGVTTAIACIAPAALPANQTQTWASGRYLDGMIIAFFLAGAVVLLRAGMRTILACAACATALFVLSAVTVAAYIGPSVPTDGWGNAFNFAEPAVLTGNWNQASVPLATAVTLGLLAVWIGFAFAARRWRAAWHGRGAALITGAFGVCVAAVSLVAVTQMTSNVSQAPSGNAQSAVELIQASGLKPGEQVAVAYGLNWPVWNPQMFLITWTQLQFFNSASQPPPAGVSVVEVPWEPGQTAQQTWPQAPPGWHIVASNQTYQWVAWRKG